MPKISNPGGGLSTDGGILTGDLKLDGASILLKDSGGTYENGLSISSDVIQLGDAAHQTSLLGSARPYYNDGADTFPVWTDGNPRVIRPTASTSIASTTLVDTKFGFEADTTSFYGFQFWFSWYTNASYDFDVAFSVPTSGTGGFYVWERGNGDETAMDGTKWMIDGGAVRGTLIWGWYYGGGTAGNVIMQRAYNSTGLYGGTIYARGYGLAWKTQDWGDGP